MISHGSLSAVRSEVMKACGPEVVRVDAKEVARFDVDVLIGFAAGVPKWRREYLRAIAMTAACGAVPGGFSVAVEIIEVPQ
jgi:hypothetical protein